MKYIFWHVSSGFGSDVTDEDLAKLLKLLKKLLLVKDSITVQEVCENTPLHSAVLGGEMPAL